ncbi:hypothetical protein [Succinimonas sp.]|uniref:hypothetical protein n=1 Tax=Succinimonas sp. TaxID=1936151 RepID=UPI003869B8A1
MRKAEVLIHTRTKQCDFPSQFTVSPSMVDSDLMEKIRKQVLLSTSSIDSLPENEVRQLVYSCGNYVIAGMVSFLKNFADSNTDDERFFYDIKGRVIFAFVGLVFEKDETNQKIPTINKNILWNIFKDNISDIWERTVIELKRGVTAELDFENETPLEPSAKAENVLGVTMYLSGSDDSSIFSYWLSRALNGENVSFCSNITDIRRVEDKQFNVITTTANIIQRMKMEVSSAKKQNHSSQSHEHNSSSEKKTSESIEKTRLTVQTNSTDTLQTSLIIIAAVLLFIIITMTVLIIRLLT